MDIIDALDKLHVLQVLALLTTVVLFYKILARTLTSVSV